MGSGSIILDHAKWPLVRLVMAGHVDESDLRRLFSQAKTVLERNEPFVLITDTRMVQHGPTAAQSQLIAGWMKEQGELLYRLMLGSIIIIQASALRGGGNALAWFVHRNTERIYVPSMKEALVTARQIAKRAGFDCEAEGSVVTPSH